MYKLGECWAVLQDEGPVRVGRANERPSPPLPGAEQDLIQNAATRAFYRAEYRAIDACLAHRRYEPTSRLLAIRASLHITRR